MLLILRLFVIGVVMVNEFEIFMYYIFWFEILIVLVIFWIFEVVFVILKNKFYLKKIYSNVNSCYEDLINVYYLFNLKLM